MASKKGDPMNRKQKMAVKALQVLETSGWTQGRRYDPPTRRRCVLGAIDAVGRTRGMTPRVKAGLVRDLSNILKEEHGAPFSRYSDPMYTIACWNDVRDRTSVEVKALLSNYAGILLELTLEEELETLAKAQRELLVKA